MEGPLRSEGEDSQVESTSNGIFAEESAISAKSPPERVAEAERLKQMGNTEYQKGVLFVKHTAGKNALAESCRHYAQVRLPLWTHEARTE
jgi:hypothetical protein